MFEEEAYSTMYLEFSENQIKVRDKCFQYMLCVYNIFVSYIASRSGSLSSVFPSASFMLHYITLIGPSLYIWIQMYSVIKANFHLAFINIMLKQLLDIKTYSALILLILNVLKNTPQKVFLSGF